MKNYTNVNQKLNKKDEKKKKKKLLEVLGISLITTLGTTLAYYTTTTDYTNMIRTAKYGHEIYHVFASPADWKPGDVTPIKFKVTNRGAIPIALRASYTERWTNSKGQVLPLRDSNNNLVSIIEFGENWTKGDDGYYYYGAGKYSMTSLDPGRDSTSFIENIKFNENIESNLTRTSSEDGTTITYTSTGEGYDGATYTFTVVIDTIQFDQAANIWR